MKSLIFVGNALVVGAAGFGLAKATHWSHFVVCAGIAAVAIVVMLMEDISSNLISYLRGLAIEAAKNGDTEVITVTLPRRTFYALQSTLLRQARAVETTQLQNDIIKLTFDGGTVLVRLRVAIPFDM